MSIDPHYSREDLEAQEKAAIETNLDIMAVMIAAELNSAQIFRLVDKLLGIAEVQERLEGEVEEKP